MATVYILHSENIDSYYIGSCKHLEIRLEEHNNKKYKNSYTAKAEDWEVVFRIDELTFVQARRIERHIKNMKSRKYIQNLIQYPEMLIKLKNIYLCDEDSTY